MYFYRFVVLVSQSVFFFPGLWIKSCGLVNYCTIRASGATSGTIISDGDHDDDYELLWGPTHEADCWWLLAATPGVEISISFQSLSIPW